MPRGSSVDGFHVVLTRHNWPVAEYLPMVPKADQLQPMFYPRLIGEPIPPNRRMRVSVLDAPGFGVDLNRELAVHRPFDH
jgi:L-rhamnonate dehydratase